MVITYTAQTGLPFFDSAAATVNGNWWYGKALESMGATSCFCYSSVNISPSYTQ